MEATIKEEKALRDEEYENMNNKEEEWKEMAKEAEERIKLLNFQL